MFFLRVHREEWFTLLLVLVDFRLPSVILTSIRSRMWFSCLWWWSNLHGELAFAFVYSDLEVKLCYYNYWNNNYSNYNLWKNQNENKLKINVLELKAKNYVILCSLPTRMSIGSVYLENSLISEGLFLWLQWGHKSKLICLVVVIFNIFLWRNWNNSVFVLQLLFRWIFQLL